MHSHIKPFQYLSILILTCLTFLIYSPGLTGGFIFDDFPNIVNNERLIIDEIKPQALINSALSTDKGGPLNRPVSMLTFSLNIFMDGMHPLPMKITNLVIHCLVGIVIFLLLKVLMLSVKNEDRENQTLTTRELSICIIAAGLWMVHPFNLTSVLYIVQRMTSLCALFVLLGLLFYCYGRLQGGGKGLFSILTALLFFGPLAFYTKENGVLLYVFILLYELFVYKHYEKWTILNKRFLICLGLIGVGIIISIAALIIKPDLLLGSYAHREFTLEERLLTQPRVLLFYMSQILMPVNAKMSLYHDNFVTSTGLLNPLSTSPAIVLIIVLLVSAVVLRQKRPLISFLILFFFAGHLLESTFLPLEMVFEHRNYLPSISLILIAILLLDEILTKINLSKLKLPLALILFVLFSINTTVRADQWGDSLLLPLFEVEKNPSSPRTNFEAARAFAIQADFEQKNEIKTEYIEKARELWLNSINLDPNNASAFASLLILHLRNNLPIDNSWLSEIEQIIQERKISASTTTAMVALFRCLKKEECTLSEQQVDSLIRHCMAMKQVSGIRRAILLQSISSFLWDYRREYKDAMFMMELAVRSAPDQGKFKLDYASMLLASGNHKQCGSVINHLVDVDQYGVFKKEIVKLRNASCVNP